MGVGSYTPDAGVPMMGKHPRNEKGTTMTLTIQINNLPHQPLEAETDANIAQAVYDAGLWNTGAYYPDFGIYEDGEQISGGGGPNSGVMTKEGRFTAFARHHGYEPHVQPNSTDDNPLINVIREDGVECAIVSMPPGPDGEDLCLCPLDLL